MMVSWVGCGQNAASYIDVSGTVTPGPRQTVTSGDRSWMEQSDIWATFARLRASSVARRPAFGFAQRGLRAIRVKPNHEKMLQHGHAMRGIAQHCLFDPSEAVVNDWPAMAEDDGIDAAYLPEYARDH